MPKATFNNLEIQVPLFKKKNANSYNLEKTKSFLESITFEKVELPIYSYNSVIFGDVDKPGKQIVGYVLGYDSETESFNVVIYERFRGFIEKFENPIVFPRTSQVHGSIIRLIGLDICPALYYANLR